MKTPRLLAILFFTLAMSARAKPENEQMANKVESMNRVVRMSRVDPKMDHMSR